MIFYFKYYFVFFLILNERPLVLFLKLVMGVSRVGYLHFFCLLAWLFPQLYKLNLIAWNLLCYLHFAFCLFVWLIKLMLRGWKTGPWSPELVGECRPLPFVQFKKREKHPWKSVFFSKSKTSPWVFFTFFKLYKWY